MNDNQQFFSLLKVAKRKLVFNNLIKYFHYGLLGLGFSMVLLMLLARIVVITHLTN